MDALAGRPPTQRHRPYLALLVKKKNGYRLPGALPYPILWLFDGGVGSDRGEESGRGGGGDSWSSKGAESNFGGVNLANCLVQS